MSLRCVHGTVRTFDPYNTYLLQIGECMRRSLNLYTATAKDLAHTEGSYISKLGGIYRPRHLRVLKFKCFNSRFRTLRVSPHLRRNDSIWSSASHRVARLLAHKHITTRPLPQTSSRSRKRPRFGQNVFFHVQQHQQYRDQKRCIHDGKPHRKYDIFNLGSTLIG